MNYQPVTYREGEDPNAVPQEGVALCLGGGGYRSMLFHLGSIMRLNETGWLKKLTRVSSVSGGSITSAMLGLKWKHLEFNDAGIAQNLETEVAAPLMRFAHATIDVPAFIVGLLPFTSPAKELAVAYSDQLFGDATLQNLPEEDSAPKFRFHATSLQTSAQWHFGRSTMGDETIALIRDPQLKLATAVAASSAFPPLLSPLKLKFHGDEYDDTTIAENYADAYTRLAVLTDGGVLDKLAMQTAWKQCGTVLVSDASAKTAPKAEVSSNWISTSLRLATMTENNTAALLKDRLVMALEAKLRTGAYWSIRSDIRNYQLADALVCPLPETTQLADLPTRYTALSPLTINRLVNWGYAICDAALRKHVDGSLAPPTKVPFPQAGTAYRQTALKSVQSPAT